MKRGRDMSQVDSTPKPQLRNGSQVCQCADCGLYFTGVAPFDRHLIGQGTAHPKCLSMPEMRALGMQENKHGVWQYGLSKKAQEAAA